MGIKENLSASLPVWTCDYCYIQASGIFCPLGWELIWDGCVCPECMMKLKPINGWFHLVNGGAFSGGKPDPRTKPKQTIELPKKPS